MLDSLLGGEPMMAANALRPTRTFLLVSDDAPALDALRGSMLAEGLHVLRCSRDQLYSVVRAFQIDAVVLLGVQDGLSISGLREAFGDSKTAVRHIAFVESADEARAFLRAVGDD